ncbi:hypothetical protein SAY87_020966 [Trapa incisa]|uniref:Uncharacterized protein n=1 Tax=Trapa incisa TaxID=236973 RepID=A0AAN7JWH9_9MYRT|nr:hypothetical protein SAY87_020966 [Trapa incisa]
MHLTDDCKDNTDEEGMIVMEMSRQKNEMGSRVEDEEVDKDMQQEMDWKTYEEFKKFMGNPSIEAAIKLEKKRRQEAE